MPAIEIRIDLGGSDGIPHSFIVVTGLDGVQRGVGFAPDPSGQVSGNGKVYDDQLRHEYNPIASSGSIDITVDQYNRLMDYIERTSAYPQPYALFFGSHCSTWIAKGMMEMMGAQNGRLMEPNNILLDFLETLAINPYTQGIANAVSNFFLRAQRWVYRADPLTFDLDGDGIETVPLDPNNPILFDHNADGIKTATGWIGPDDAFLVLDRNGNGTIDNGSELFGDSTPLSGGGNAADGFAALQDQDTNADGQVNASDANFANLRLWRDLNQDGVSQANELFTLPAAGIASITVAKTENNTLLPNGNVLADVGSYTRTDGTVGGIGEIGHLGDVDLTENTFFSQYPSIPLSPEAQALPDIHGSGRVRNLREATSLSGDLTSALTTYAHTPTRAGQIGQLDGLLLKWSQSSDMPDIVSRALSAGYLISFSFANAASDANRGNATQLTSGLPDNPYTAQLLYNNGQSAVYQEWIDKISVLERFNGRSSNNIFCKMQMIHCTPAPSPLAA